jgi:hypothetical protein
MLQVSGYQGSDVLSYHGIDDVVTKPLMMLIPRCVDVITSVEWKFNNVVMI